MADLILPTRMENLRIDETSSAPTAETDAIVFFVDATGNELKYVDESSTTYSLKVGSAAALDAGTLNGEVLLISVDNTLPILSAVNLTNILPTPASADLVLRSTGNTDGDYAWESEAPGRKTYVGATSSIGHAASENIQIATKTSGLLARISTDVPSFFRLYSSAAARTADATRLKGTPAPDDIEGFLYEGETTAINLDVDCSPAVPFVNLEGTQTTDIFLLIFNLSGGASVVNVTLHIE